MLATWEEAVPDGPGGIAIDSAEVRARFGLPAFTGQLFIHAIGVAGHDVVKYALDTFGTGNDASLSCTHDANAWPSDRYAGLPAPRGGRAGDAVGAEQPCRADPRRGRCSWTGWARSGRWRWSGRCRAFATVALDVAELLPELRWPAQIELRAGRHVVRPRYEVVREGRTRIAHANVERADLAPDPNIPVAAGADWAAAICCRCRCCRGRASAP